MFRTTSRIGAILCAVMAGAGHAATVDKADTALLISSSALVLFMTLPGLALFYGGLVRAKNFLSVLMHCFALTGLASLLWYAGAYSLVFRGDGAWIGDLSAMGLANLAPVRDGLAVPENIFALYQMTFAVITPALIVGAFPERVRFGWMMLFSALWIVLVYVPAAHWIWGNGWLAAMGVRDFAGGIVVHTTAGISALVLAMMIGPRRGFPQSLIPPHSAAMTMIGAGMLWVGWFGFNGGSALVADGTAGNALLATHLAASAAALTWAAIEKVKIGKPTSIGLVTGAIAGLATITPAAGWVSPTAAVALGVAGSLVCFVAVMLVKHRWKIDDSLDVFAVHGVGGMLGSLLLAVLAQPALGGTSPAGLDVPSQLGVQALAVAVVAVFSAVLTWVIAFVAGLFLPMRVDAEAEHDGLDLSLHGERAYEFD
ncbi:ammonium transporter [Sphingomonas montanisoli]|uniref:Ammonium transporter n=1 Tax=Sphingomonas montanisoli TaxID=2606412 RepID=A0A5D9CC88_9SPHN|nr:ammonium transporter [Sphingomonas montanisoli]TZG29289.1 ammonium transporter [Sphingomonas montanisoli]